MKIGSIVLLLLLPAAVPGQPALDGESARVLRFAHAASSEERQEVANAIRAVAEVQRLAVDNPARLLAVRGPGTQLDFAAWIFGELDRAPREAAATAMEQYEVPGDYLPQARAFFLAHGNPQTTQEIVNALRTVADLQHVTAYNATRAIVLRGASDQVQLAAWIVRNLDQTAGAAEAKPLEYTYNDPSPRQVTAVRMFRMGAGITPQAMQELVNAVRIIAEVQRIMMNTDSATITLRATPAQAAMAAWLIKEFERQPAH